MLRFSTVIIKDTQLSIIHEFGHYVDRADGCSKTKKFKKYYKKYAKDYVPIEAVQKGYQNNGEKEFFAILFADYTTHPEDNDIPNEVQKYMKKCYEKFIE